MQSSAQKIRLEAAWVISNALTQCSDETLLRFTAQYFGILVEPFANLLNQISSDTKLLHNMLECLYRLLDLDATGNLKLEDGSLCFMFEQV